MFLKIKMLFLLLGLMLGSVESRADSVVQMLGSRFMERASIVALNESGCAPPWIETTVGCIVFLHTEVDTWAGAQAECDSLGGFLVEAKTEEEALILSQLAMVLLIIFFPHLIVIFILSSVYLFFSLISTLFIGCVYSALCRLLVVGAH